MKNFLRILFLTLLPCGTTLAQQASWDFPKPTLHVAATPTFTSFDTTFSFKDIRCLSCGDTDPTVVMSGESPTRPSGIGNPILSDWPVLFTPTPSSDTDIPGLVIKPKTPWHAAGPMDPIEDPYRPSETDMDLGDIGLVIEDKPCSTTVICVSTGQW